MQPEETPTAKTKKKKTNASTFLVRRVRPSLNLGPEEGGRPDEGGGGGREGTEKFFNMKKVGMLTRPWMRKGRR